MVLLTNGDNGGILLGPFRRRLMDILFGGKPEAAGDLDSAAQNYHAYMSEERQRLVVPASADEAAKLAVHYTSEALGSNRVKHQGANAVLRFDSWQRTAASRRQALIPTPLKSNLVARCIVTGGVLRLRRFSIHSGNSSSANRTKRPQENGCPVMDTASPRLPKRVRELVPMGNQGPFRHLKADNRHEDAQHGKRFWASKRPVAKASWYSNVSTCSCCRRVRSSVRSHDAGPASHSRIS